MTRVTRQSFEIQRQSTERRLIKIFESLAGKMDRQPEAPHWEGLNEVDFANALNVTRLGVNTPSNFLVCWRDRFGLSGTVTRQSIERAKSSVLDSLSFAWTMTIGYLEVLDIRNYIRPSDPDSDLRFWIDWMVAKYCLYALAGAGEAYLKYQTTLFLERSVGSVDGDVLVRPECMSFLEKDGLFLPPLLQRRVSLKCSTREWRRRDLTTAYTLYQTKRISVPMPEDLVSASLKKCFNTLTTDREDEGDVDPDHENSDLFDEIERTGTWLVDSLYELHRSAGKRLSPDLRIPSVSASLEVSRQHGGQFGALFPFSESSCLDPVRFLVGYARLGLRVSPVYVRDDPEEIARILRPTQEYLARKETSSILVRQQAILEPFKVRVVSMGEAQGYQIARNFQRRFWDLLQMAPCLTLTGEPIGADHIRRTVQWQIEANGGFLKDLMYMSGDYSAATDNLNPRLSEVLLERLMVVFRVPFQERQVLLGALTGHSILDPETKQTSEFTPQRWGQLMGSPISFPILCLANLAVNLVVLRRCGRLIPMMHRHGRHGPTDHLWDCDARFLAEFQGVLVNGDDVFSMLSRAEYPLWKRAVALCGLSPSPGKNYLTDRCAVMNSDLFKIELVRAVDDWLPDVVVEHVPVIRMNLMRVVQENDRRPNLFSGEGSLEHGKTLRGRAEELVRGWDSVTADVLMRRFLMYAKPILDDLPPISWFLPMERGGLGLPLTREVVVAEDPESNENTIRIEHLRIAAFLACCTPRSLKARLKMSWLREKSPAFSKEAFLYEQEVYDALKVPIISRPREEHPNSPLIGRLLKGMLTLGPDFEIIDGRQFLRSWRNWYYDTWKKAKATQGTLHAMGSKKALIRPEMVPDRDLSGFVFDRMI